MSESKTQNEITSRRHQPLKLALTVDFRDIFAGIQSRPRRALH
jgi:hypothetical protein